MVKIISLIFAISSFSVFAGSHTARISHIDYARIGESSTLLYLSDSSVLKLSSRKEIKFYEEALKEKQLLRFTTDESRNILDTEEIPLEPDIEPFFQKEESFSPTVLNSMEEANNIFRNLRKGARSRSQCYNRAHIWSYESKNKFNLDSMKVFVFYTRKYIREFNFGWWFHVAPFTYVEEAGAKKEMVLDFRFAKSPVDMKTWTDLFMKNKVTCPVINKYTEYENNQEAQYCYLQKASMYYLQPLDLENLEASGKIKTQWLNYEISRAYRNGFGIW